MSEEAEGPSVTRHLQKPFRISDVLAMLQEVFAAAPSDATTRMNFCPCHFLPPVQLFGE